MRILLNANKAILFGLASALIIVDVSARCVGSDNIVGYQRSKISKGETILALPSRINRSSSEVLIGTLLYDKDVCRGAILDGDQVAVLIGNNEVWATISESVDGELTACSSTGESLDDCVLPNTNGVSYLKIRRNSDCETFITLSGEYDVLAPLHYSCSASDIPLSKIQIEKGVADDVPRFDVVMRNGTRTTVRIRESDRLIVDVDRGEPLNVKVSEIVGFDRPTLRSDKRHEVRPKDIVDTARALKEGVEQYDAARKLRDSLFGPLWDRRHPIASLCCWIVGFIFLRVFGLIVDAGLRRLWRATPTRKVRGWLVVAASAVVWRVRRVVR